MNTEKTIRQELVAFCSARGKQAEVSKALKVHPSTVKRWIEGGEIPHPILKLLDWFLFGKVPERIAAMSDLQSVLDFDEDEWKWIGMAARREGTDEAKWIAGRIRAYLEYVEKPLGERVGAGKNPLPSQAITDTSKIVNPEKPLSVVPDLNADEATA